MWTNGGDRVVAGPGGGTPAGALTFGGRRTVDRAFGGAGRSLAGTTNASSGRFARDHRRLYRELRGGAAIPPERRPEAVGASARSRLGSRGTVRHDRPKIGGVGCRLEPATATPSVGRDAGRFHGGPGTRIDDDALVRIPGSRPRRGSPLARCRSASRGLRRLIRRGVERSHDRRQRRIGGWGVLGKQVAEQR